MRFDAVIFDLYGTLVDSVDAPGPNQLSAYKFGPPWTIASALGAPARALRGGFGTTPPLPDRMTGAHPSASRQYVEYALPSVLDVQSRGPSSWRLRTVRIRLDMFRAQLVAARHGLPSKLSSNLRAMGHRIGLITDCSWETPQLWPDTATPITTSTRRPSRAPLACASPTRASMRSRVSSLGVAPERCLYVGDGGSNELAGAERVGHDRPPYPRPV